MKFLLVALACIAAANAFTVENWYDQRIDHFNPQNPTFFSQRYYTNAEFYRDGGPIFIYVGGHETLNPQILEPGSLMQDIAAIDGGLLVAVEMRYFGASRPTLDLSTENLRFLQTDQVLADIAHLIQYIRDTRPGAANSRVALSGSGFGGALAIWARAKYPHLVDGAWGSSAFLEARFNFFDFNIDVGQTIERYGGQNCYDRIYRAHRVAENLLDSDNFETLETLFRLCNPIDRTNNFDKYAFFEQLLREIDTYIVTRGSYGARDLCLDITSTTNSENDLIALGHWFYEKYNADGVVCIDRSFDQMIENLSQEEWTSNVALSGLRQRYYQQCTEFSVFITTDADRQPFGTRIPLSLSVERCRRVFGNWISEQSIFESVARTNTRYGGRAPVVTNVLFTHGALDPFRQLSVLEEANPSAHVIIIPGQVASSDLQSISIFDEPEVIRAKEEIKLIVNSWLFAGITPGDKKTDEIEAL